MKHFLVVFFSSIIILGVGVGSSVWAEELAVVGVPMIQARSSIEVSLNVNIDNNQKMTNRLTISLEDGVYYWVTRDRLPLEFKKMKGYDLFVEPNSGGYIKIVKQSDGRYVYLEHVSGTDLKVFNYWGIVTVYEP